MMLREGEAMRRIIHGAALALLPIFLSLSTSFGQTQTQTAPLPPSAGLDVGGYYEGQVGRSPDVREVRIQPPSQGNMVLWLQRPGPDGFVLNGGPGTYTLESSGLVLKFPKNKTFLHQEGNSLVGFTELPNGRQIPVRLVRKSIDWDDHRIGQQQCKVTKSDIMHGEGGLLNAQGVIVLQDGEKIKQMWTGNWLQCRHGVYITLAP